MVFPVGRHPRQEQWGKCRWLWIHSEQQRSNLSNKQGTASTCLPANPIAPLSRKNTTHWKCEHYKEQQAFMRHNGYSLPSPLHMLFVVSEFLHYCNHPRSTEWAQCLKNLYFLKTSPTFKSQCSIFFRAQGQRGRKLCPNFKVLPFSPCLDRSFLGCEHSF